MPISGGENGSPARPEEVPTVGPRLLGNVIGPVDGATYIIGPGDELEIHFSGAIAQSIMLAVGPEGFAYIRGFGTARIGGLSLDQARRELRRVVGGDLRRDVVLDIQLARVRMLRVFPAGEVANTAPVELPATARASEALAAGNLVTPLGSRRNVELRRRDGTREFADLERYVRLGDLRGNPLLRDDDVLFVPPARAFIEASGAVAHPVRLELGPADSLSDLLDLCGGALPSARRDRALFVRWNGPTTRDSLWIGLDDILARRFDPPLRDGDRLFVYSLPEYHRLESASIVGEVQSPGVYPLQPGVTHLSDLVRAAGGFGPRADLSAIRIYRPRPDTGESDIEFERLSRLSRNEMTTSEYDRLRTRLVQRRADFRVDWNRLSRVPAEDIALVNGDVVRVDPTVATVRVEGEVRRPGLVRYEPGTTLARYISDAGGFSARSAGNRTLITRAVTGQTLPAREVSSIEPGDMIWVPERPDRSIWQNIGTLIAVSAQVATLIIAVRR